MKPSSPVDDGIHTTSAEDGVVIEDAVATIEEVVEEVAGDGVVVERADDVLDS